MIGLGIILAHLIADYVLQNDWMAREKVSRWSAALLHGWVHALVHSVMIVLLIPHSELIPAVFVCVIIGGSHAVIDRFRLAKQLIWVVNQAVPRAERYSWREAKGNAGYSAAKPPWMSTWLMIIVDNTLHLTINTLTIGLVLL